MFCLGKQPVWEKPSLTETETSGSGTTCSQSDNVDFE